MGAQPPDIASATAQQTENSSEYSLCVPIPVVSTLEADMEPTGKSSSTGPLVAELGFKTDRGCNFHNIRFAETNTVK